MKKVASVVLSFLICFTAVPWSVLAVETAPVTGTVADAKGQPIAMARIVAMDDRGSVVGTATTNTQGQYSMSLPVGKKYILNLEPPPPFRKPAQGVTVPVLAAAGAVVNATQPPDDDDNGAFWWVLGGTTALALSVGLGVGLGGGGSDKKKPKTPSN